MGVKKVKDFDMLLLDHRFLYRSCVAEAAARPVTPPVCSESYTRNRHCSRHQITLETPNPKRRLYWYSL